MKDLRLREGNVFGTSELIGGSCDRAPLISNEITATCVSGVGIPQSLVNKGILYGMNRGRRVRAPE